MSGARCADCHELVDLDHDPDALVYVGNYKRLHATEVVCEACREIRWNELERQYEQQSWHESQGDHP